jgi:predicted AAA+ superfamily ATPase
MEAKPRLYQRMLENHLARYRQMAFVSGPRQVGKTTTCRSLSSAYLNWDNADDRLAFLGGPAVVAARLGIDQLQESRKIATFDELHKNPRWKAFLKGFFDSYEDRVRLLVTGSSRLDVFRRGGDSLMGRYFLFRMHPWSVAECLHVDLPDKPIRDPMPPREDDWNALWTHGGFPEPFLLRDQAFTLRWLELRQHQLTREDMRYEAQIRDLGTMDALSRILAERSGQQLVFSNLSQNLGISIDTVRRWVDLLSRLHFGFLVRPFSSNITKAIRKEPKWFLRDWSGIKDDGARAETFMACHLLKAVEGWSDLGLGEFELRYVRDKSKQEVDFLIVRDRKPWVLIEVKHSDTRLSPALLHFQSQIQAPHALQAVFNLPYVAADCFQAAHPLVVPARTLLSQLL